MRIAPEAKDVSMASIAYVPLPGSGMHACVLPSTRMICMSRPCTRSRARSKSTSRLPTNDLPALWGEHLNTCNRCYHEWEFRALLGCSASQHLSLSAINRSPSERGRSFLEPQCGLSGHPPHRRRVCVGMWGYPGATTIPVGSTLLQNVTQYSGLGPFWPTVFHGSRIAPECHTV